MCGAPILLGSITTAKYVDVLLSVFAQATFLAEFVSRGDMSLGWRSCSGACGRRAHVHAGAGCGAWLSPA